MRDDLSPPAGHPPSWRDRLLVRFRRNDWRGFVKLYGLLKPRSRHRMLRTVSKYGTQFFLNPWDSVDTHVLREGFYESEVLEAARPHLQTAGTLWVVGANFGLHAITAKKLFPHLRVIAFEPSPAMGARILENCELNSVSLELHTYALSDRAGVLPFFANASGNPGMSTLHPTDTAAYDHQFCVATVSAAELLDAGKAPPPDVLIVDAEGAELEIFRGFGRHLARLQLAAVIFEAENEFLERPRDGLRDTLESAGFALMRLERRENTAHSLSNYIATRPAR
jgi:FkbM family methyltransferase